MKKPMIFAALAALMTACGGNKASDTDEITVACYYFANYHTGEPRNEASKGVGWNEWELVKSAKPRFEGHRQPNPGAIPTKATLRPWLKR